MNDTEHADSALFRRWANLLGAAAIILMPWQARWIFAYRTLAGERYEYGTMGVYAGSVVVALAAVFFWNAYGFRRRQVTVVCSWFAWLILMALFAADAPFAMWTVILMVCAFGYFLIARSMERRRLTTAIIAGGILQSFIAWWQFISQRVAASTLLGVAEHAPVVLGDSVVVIFGKRVLRAYGMLPHPNILGGFLAVALAVLVLRYIEFLGSDATPRDTRRWARYVAGILFLFSALLISFSRAALLSFVLLMILWWLLSRFQHAPALRNGVRDVLVLCAVLGIVFNFIAGNIWLQRFGVGLPKQDVATSEQRLEEQSLSQRAQSYYEAVALFTVRSLTIGVGPGNYVLRLSRTFAGYPSYQYQPVHNSYIMALVEVGALGCILLVSLLFHLLHDAWKAAVRATAPGMLLLPSLLLLIGCIALFDHYLWTSYFGQSLFWLAAGCFARLSRNETR